MDNNNSFAFTAKLNVMISSINKPLIIGQFGSYNNRINNINNSVNKNIKK